MSIQNVRICNKRSRWRKLLAANGATSFTSGGLLGVWGPPTAAGTVKLGDNVVPEWIFTKGFGTDAANEAFSVRYWGWEDAPENQKTGATGTVIWHEPVLLAELLFTLGSVTGQAGGLIVAADLIADTIAITEGNTADVKVVSDENNLSGAYAAVRTWGLPYMTMEIDKGTGVNGNLLWREV